MSILSLNNVNAYYDKSHILFDVSLEVNAGQCVCLLGRNGVGKSTLIKSIMGYLNPKSHCKTEGNIRYGDKELVGLNPYQVASMGIAYVPQGRHIFSSLSTHENLLIAQKKGVDGSNYWTIEKIHELFPRLKEREKCMGGKLSGGEQQMLAVARGLMQNPKLLLLDEITEGLAPIIVKQLADIVTELNSRGVTILVAEQSIKFALSVSQDCYILEKGAIVLHEPTKDISKESIERYLGTST
jgi:branched-chain amino acid transport system ATP-binding protein